MAPLLYYYCPAAPAPPVRRGLPNARYAGAFTPAPSAPAAVSCPRRRRKDASIWKIAPSLGRVVIFTVITAPATVITAPATVITAPATVITAPATVIPAPSTVIPAPSTVIPAKAGIYACQFHYRSRGCTTLDSGESRNDGCRGTETAKTDAILW